MFKFKNDGACNMGGEYFTSILFIDPYYSSVFTRRGWLIKEDTM